MNNLPLILQTIKDQSDKTIMVKQDEDEQKEKGTKSKGTYVFLSVAPQIDNKELCDRFKKTVWKVTDIIPVIHSYVPNLQRAELWNQHGGVNVMSSRSRAIGSLGRGWCGTYTPSTRFQL